MGKINIAELLKDCPKGMELDCMMYDNLYFDEVNTIGDIKCYIKSEDGYLTHITFHENGCYDNISNAKCVIFPKGKTTWEGFHRPFKDGDIVVYYDNPYREYLQIFIFKDKEENNILSNCYLMLDGDELDLKEGMYYVARFATEEEKQKLFQAIKDSGYKWNPETKTLEKLIEPKFKVGNVIQDKDGYKVKITEVNVDDECYGYESMIAKGIGGISFSEQDNWELVPNKFDITTLKPFESKVLVRNYDSDYWKPATFGFAGKDKNAPFCVEGGNFFNKCIPYEGNEHLLHSRNDCDDYYKL